MRIPQLLKCSQQPMPVATLLITSSSFFLFFQAISAYPTSQAPKCKNPAKRLVPYSTGKLPSITSCQALYPTGKLPNVTTCQSFSASPQLPSIRFCQSLSAKRKILQSTSCFTLLLSALSNWHAPQWKSWQALSAFPHCKTPKCNNLPIT